MRWSCMRALPFLLHNAVCAAPGLEAALRHTCLVQRSRHRARDRRPYALRAKGQTNLLEEVTILQEDARDELHLEHHAEEITLVDLPLLVSCCSSAPTDPIEAQECRHVPPQEGRMKEVKMVADMNNRLERECYEQSEKLDRLKQLEKTLLKVSFQEDNFTVICPNIQTFVFKINPMKFRGLNLISKSILFAPGNVSASTSQPESRTQHSMRFPAELVNKSRRRAAEMKLVCIYLNTPGLFQDNSNASCVFWVEGTENSSLGNWSSAGCETTHCKDVVLCQCKHLTYFAVLLKISSVPIDEAILAPLTYISMVGCSVSAAASLLTVLHYLASRKKSRDYTTKIHMNLLGALFLLNVFFLLSGPLALVQSTWLCRGTAAFLQYSLLCCLTWMAIEGFHLYLLLIKVYNVYIRRYVLKLCAVGWGLPALTVVSILIFKEETYGLHIIETDTGYNNTTMCWITDKAQDVHYILNVGYAGITVLFNMVILVTVMRMLRKLRSNINSQKEQMKKDLVTVLGLTCLLGTTWALAFLSFGVFLIPQLILFTIINSLLGFFICLWYCTVRRQPDPSPSTGSSQMTK
ncbi:adhesion G-protein coupled receptor G5 isoform X3 [Mauremys reevesii]|uniref:adhesion G-protein coupled receptor G5 isoform X3 n=1 Tax=Mauremys reevesii TaxID=260615 RepID=UPI00193F9F2B|nr:adhesion G-protein coupled receptor G5 isoform X3 [Mauremys reevesii]